MMNTQQQQLHQYQQPQQQPQRSASIKKWPPQLPSGPHIAYNLQQQQPSYSYPILAPPAPSSINRGPQQQHLPPQFNSRYTPPMTASSLLILLANRITHAYLLVTATTISLILLPISVFLLPLTLFVASPLIVVVSATAYIIHALQTTWGMSPHLSLAARLVIATGQTAISVGRVVQRGASYVMTPLLQRWGLAKPAATQESTPSQLASTHNSNNTLMSESAVASATTAAPSRLSINNLSTTTTLLNSPLSAHEMTIQIDPHHHLTTQPPYHTAANPHPSNLHMPSTTWQRWTGKPPLVRSDEEARLIALPPSSSSSSSAVDSRRSSRSDYSDMPFLPMRDYPSGSGHATTKKVEIGKDTRVQLQQDWPSDAGSVSSRGSKRNPAKRSSLSCMSDSSERIEFEDHMVAQRLPSPFHGLLTPGMGTSQFGLGIKKTEVLTKESKIGLLTPSEELKASPLEQLLGTPQSATAPNAPLLSVACPELVDSAYDGDHLVKSVMEIRAQMVASAVDTESVASRSSSLYNHVSKIETDRQSLISSGSSSGVTPTNTAFQSRMDPDRQSLMSVGSGAGTGSPLPLHHNPFFTNTSGGPQSTNNMPQHSSSRVPKVLYRILTPSDTDIIALCDMLLAGSPSHQSTSSPDGSPSNPVSRVMVGRTASGELEYQVLVMVRRGADTQALMPNDIVGFLEFYHTVWNPTHLRIEKLLIAPVYEGLGFGHKLLKQLHKLPSVEKVEVYSVWRAEAFYKRVGYCDAYTETANDLETPHVSDDRDGGGQSSSSGRVRIATEFGPLLVWIKS